MLSSHTDHRAPASSKPTASRKTALYERFSSSIRPSRRATRAPLGRRPAFQQAPENKYDCPQHHQLQLTAHAVVLSEADVEGITYVGKSHGLKQLGQIEH